MDTRNKNCGLPYNRCYYPHWSRDALPPVCGIFLSTTSTNFDISINLSCIFSIIKIKSNKLSTTKESGIMPGSMGFMNLWHIKKVRGLRQRLSNLFSLYRLVAKSVSLMIFIQLRKSRVGFNFEPMRRYG